MLISIGNMHFHLEKIPESWHRSEFYQRLMLFSAPDIPPADRTFSITFTGTVEHPSLSVFKKTGNTFHHYSKESKQHFFITDEMKSVIHWPDRYMNIELVNSSTIYEMDDIDKLAVQLRLLTSFVSVAEGGIPLHSSCVMHDTTGIIFFGRSGAGKTTIARIMKRNGWTLLNDEYNLIMPWKNSFRVFSTPFTRRSAADLYNPQSGTDIQGLYFLRKGPFGINESSAENSVKQLFESVYLFPDFNGIQEQLLSTIFSVNELVPVFECTFEKNDTTARKLATFIQSSNHG